MFDDDDNGKSWFSSFINMLMETPDKNRAATRQFLSDDDSCSSMDSKGKKRRRVFRRKSATSRRQGNIKLSNFSR